MYSFQKFIFVVFSLILIVAIRSEDVSNTDSSSADNSGGSGGGVGGSESSAQSQMAESKAESKAVNLHRIDTLNIMLYTALLILTVLTVWLFKHRRLRFVHETGLTLIYGLIVGLIIWLTSSDSDTKYIMSVVPKNESETPPFAPDYIRLQLPNKSDAYFRYKFAGEEKFSRDQQFDSLMEMKATFDPEVFFNVLLPPIMFNAGFSLKRRHFFRNIGSILLFAIGGTTVSCVVVGFFMYGVATLAGLSRFTLSESMLFGALISATDPVTVLAIFNDLQVENDLFAVVFGESALNDAVAIVLVRTIEQYSPSGAGTASTIDAMALLNSFGTFLGSFLGSISVGALCGCAAALLMKFTKIRDFPILESSLFVLISYMSFLTAEASGMTGVVAALFCGICQAHYTFNNLSDESKQRTKQFFELLNFLSENFIFTYIGVSLFTSKARAFNVWFILGAFAAIIIGRAAFVYPFSFILNLARRPKIPCSHQHIIMFAGLRGAVAFALAIRNTATYERCLIYTATALIVIITVFFQGGLTIPVIDWLKIKHGEEQDTELQTPTSALPPSLSQSQNPFANPIDTTSRNNPYDKSFAARKWYNFDRRFLKPLLTNSRPTLIDTAPQCCLPLARLLTTTEQMSTALGAHSTTGSDGGLVEEETYHDEIIVGGSDGAVVLGQNNTSLPDANASSDGTLTVSHGPTSDSMTQFVRISNNNGGHGAPV